MKNFITCLTILFCCASCGDYLDLVPENDIQTFESIFETRNGADQWITTIHYGLMDYTNIGLVGVQAAGVIGADEFVTNDYNRNSSNSITRFGINLFGAFSIGEGLQMSQEPYDNQWKDQGLYKYIRMCNTFLSQIDQVYNMEQTEKRQWTAEVQAIKAFYYFELVRRYGPIVLVPENIGVEASLEEMKQPRSHVDTCFKAIVNLLDEAIPNLLTNAEHPAIRRGYFCKEAAMALKARVLLYAASPLFNGNDFYVNFKNKNGEPLFSDTYDPEKWKLAAEAAEAAIEECNRSGRKLVTGRITRNTQLQRVMDDIEWSTLVFNATNDECLFFIRYPNTNIRYFNYILPHDEEDVTIDGSFGPSMKMVEMFYTENGLPIENDKTWNYTGRYRMSQETSAAYKDVVPLNEDVLSLHLRREPRFYANIAADRCYWRRGPAPTMEEYKMEAYRGEKHGLWEQRLISTVPQNICGYWIKKFTCSDVETTWYFQNIASMGESSFPIIRLAELYLIQAEAWNEYEGPLVDRAHVYEPLNMIRERAGIPDVETSWNSYSNSPDKVKTKEGMREIIQREWNIEFAFEGYRFWNLRRWKTAHEELNDPIKGWNVLGETAREFYNNFEGPIVVWNKAQFLSPRDYLFPIKSEEVLVSGIVQNPGW